MNTKFIGLDGFGKIETLKTTRKIKKHYAKRTIRFFKQKVQATYCLAKSFEKPKQRDRRKTPTLDACYRNARMGNNEFSVKILDFSPRCAKKQIKKKSYSVRYKRGLQPISTNFMKHKAVLGTMTACVAGAFTVLSVFTAVGVNSNAAENISETKTALLSQSLSNNELKDTHTYVGIATDDSKVSVDTVMLNDVASTITAQESQTAGLYIDGKFVGAVGNKDELCKALDDLLEAAKGNYDYTTTTEYVNEVEVKPGEYKSSEIVPTSELIKKISSTVEISLTTEVYSEREIDYDTEIEYDDSKDSSYEEIKQEGKSGLEKVTYKVTYIDGNQVDSVEIDSKVIKEPVNEIVVKGSQETDEVSATVSGETGVATGNFIWPVPNTHNITSGYGYRWGTTHTGLDISNGVTDETIVASDGGTVTWAGYDDSGYGNYVIIDHGNGYQTLYGHCNSIYVSIGDYVSQGQTIAGMGTTGDSTGTHLHFEIRLGSSRLDPSGFVS